MADSTRGTAAARRRPHSSPSHSALAAPFQVHVGPCPCRRRRAPCRLWYRRWRRRARRRRGRTGRPAAQQTTALALHKGDQAGDLSLSGCIQRSCRLLKQQLANGVSDSHHSGGSQRVQEDGEQPFSSLPWQLPGQCQPAVVEALCGDSAAMSICGSLREGSVPPAASATRRKSDRS